MKKVILLMFITCLFMGCKNEAGSEKKQSVLEIKNETDTATLYLSCRYTLDCNTFNFSFADSNVTSNCAEGYVQIPIEPKETKEFVINDFPQNEVTLFMRYRTIIMEEEEFSFKKQFSENNKTVVTVKEHRVYAGDWGPDMPDGIQHSVLIIDVY